MYHPSSICIKPHITNNQEQMKNLMSQPILVRGIDRSGPSILEPAEVTPKLIRQNPHLLGSLPHHGANFMAEGTVTVDFTGIELNPDDQPFIVSREVFDALPEDRVEFITPDFDTTVLTALSLPPLVTTFMAKAAARMSAKVHLTHAEPDDEHIQQ